MKKTEQQFNSYLQPNNLTLWSNVVYLAVAIICCLLTQNIFSRKEKFCINGIYFNH